MQVRTFRPEDQAAARDLIQAGMAERWGDAFDPTANSDTHDLWASYMTNGRISLVIEDNGTLVGTGALVPESSGVSRILRMSVDRGHRRRGIARMLIVELLEVAQQLGTRKVVVLRTHLGWTQLRSTGPVDLRSRAKTAPTRTSLSR